MSNLNLTAMTVIELRKLAKEKHVTLGAGLSKGGIVAKLQAALDEAPEAPQATPEVPERTAEPTNAAAPVPSSEPTPKTAPTDAPAEPTPAASAPAASPAASAPAASPAASAPAASPAAPAAAAPQFKAAWHNPAPRYSSKPAYQSNAYQPRPAWQGRAPQSGRGPIAEPQRTTAPRPAGYTPRFGPDAGDTAAAPRQEEYRPSFRETPRSGYGMPEERPAYQERAPYQQDRPAYQPSDRPAYQDRAPYQQDRPAYNPERPAYQPRQGYGEGGFQQQPGGYDNGYRRFDRPAYQPRRNDTGYYNPELGTSNPAVPEMLAAGECSDGQGVLELHPDGYGFLRPENFLPSSRDIYVSMAQIRRFGLRTGDLVVGKTRPQRDGDKYAAMLYITGINGVAPDEVGVRPVFDELTPVYPSRRIDLEGHEEGKGSDAMRITDLIAPIGFGQRGLVLCPPDAGKTQVLQDFANVIHANCAEATVIVLLIDVNPEDVTLFKEQTSCEVVASTFDQAPENHLRLTEMVLERAERLVEQKQDVVVIVDSLTRLAKTYTTAAAQQGRSLPGMVSPTSLFRAKKLFGAARCVKEGGSLTVIGAMNIENGNKVDDTVVEEFKGTANMELVLDAALAKAGITPAISLNRSGTRRADMLLTQEQQEGLTALRQLVGQTPGTTAVPQLLSLMEKAASNEALLARIKDLVALAEKNK